MTFDTVLSTLYDASRLLESLCELTGVQSFVLAVDPNNPSDTGFLGGTVKGREFWRGLRGGGAHGAKAFKSHCLRDVGPSTFAANPVEGSLSSRAPSITSAKSLKTDLYDSVRKALRFVSILHILFMPRPSFRSTRTVSGVRNAEMKWTNPENLDVYGVRLVGWPPTIPAQNPSSLKASQNKHLLQCLENGTMRFEKIGSIFDGNSCEAGEETIPDESCDQEDFSWAYIEDGVDPSLVGCFFWPISSSTTNEMKDGNGRCQQNDSLSVLPHQESDPQYTYDGRASIAHTATVYQGSNDTSVEAPRRKRPRNDC